MMLKKVGQLIVGFIAIGFFIVGVNQLRRVAAPLDKIATEIDRQGLESDALFYSESPKAVEAG
ncbi:MAG: hypothetical protein AAF242_02200, partial [Bacteroidota bacterium]